LVQRESRYFENHEQDSQQGDQPPDPSLEPQDFTLQLSRVHIERVEGHDLDARGAQPAARRRTRDAALDRVVHVLCRLDEFPKAVVIPILSAGRGNHDHIMVPAASRSIFRDRITRADWLCCRQLAMKTAECRDRQLVSILELSQLFRESISQ